MHRIMKIFTIAGLLIAILILLSCSDKSTEPEPEDNIATWQYAFVNNDVASMYVDVISADNNELMAIGYHTYRYCVDRFDEMGDLLWSKDHNEFQISSGLPGGCIKKGSDGYYYMLGSGSSPATLSVLRMSDDGDWYQRQP